MENKITKIMPLLKTCLWLFLIGMIFAFLLYFKSILIPFIYAVVVAFLVQELVLLIGKINFGGKPLPYWFRSLLVLLLVFGTILGIVEIIIANAEQLIQKAPTYKATFDRLLIQIGDLTGAQDISAEIQRQVNSTEMKSGLSNLFSSFSAFLGNLFMVIIYSIFMLMERSSLSPKICAIVPDPTHRSELQSVLERIAIAIRQYISVKTFASLLTGALSYIILLFFGVDFPLLWAFLIFLLNYIPYLGSFIATLLPSLLAIFQFESLLMGLWVFLFIQVVQLIVGTFIEPRFAGKTLNLSPTIVLLSLALWGFLWGIIGMAIAVPVTSIMVITFAEFPSTRNVAILLSEKGEFSADIET